MKTDKKSKTSNAVKAGNTGSASNTRKTSGEAKAPAVSAAFTPHQKQKGKAADRLTDSDKKALPSAWPTVLGAGFTQALAREIVKNLTTLGQLTSRPFRRAPAKPQLGKPILGERPILLDSSVLIDGRILPIVNSGFVSGTLVVPQFILDEVQHIADNADPIKRTKGRRGLEVVNKLKGQKANPLVKTKIITEDLTDVAEVDGKLVTLAKKWGTAILTVDFNLAQVARARGVRVLNVTDLAQALKVALVPGEELALKVTHPGREREQGVGYLPDGTMVVVENAKDKVGLNVAVVITKVHQTPAGQLFFARLK